MNIVVLFIILLLERSLGSTFLVIPAITVMLYNTKKDDLPKFALISGLITDLLFGNSLGLSSFIFLISSVEISLYKAKLESNNLASVFLFGLLVSTQVDLFWSISQPASRYLLHALLSVVIHLLAENLSTKKGGGIYLKV